MDTVQSSCPQHSLLLKLGLGVGRENGGHSHFQVSERENATKRQIYRTLVQQAADLKAVVLVSVAYRA